MNLRLFIFLFVLFLPGLAKADYFVWQDEKSGLSLTFPDTWKMQNNANPDTIATVAGPSDLGKPICRVDVRDDKRYIIYPARYQDAVQKVAVSRPFWQKFLSQYDEYNLGDVYDGAGLGRGFASYALASYGRHFGTVMQSRQALMFASLYRDKLFVVECSALAHEYDRWEMDFRGIIKSIDFKKAYHELPTGEYANFLNEAEMYFWAPQGPEGTTAY
jgi:hypothetical protein